MKPIYLLLTPVIFLSFSCSVQTQKPERETNFNANWQFISADVANVEQPTFDDSAWRNLDLPHDFRIEDLPVNDSVKQIGPF